MDIRKLQRAIVDGLEDVKAQDILVFNTEHLSPLFERVIVASGASNRQTKALASSVRDAVKSAGLPVLATEGEDNGEWIIVDCGAAVAHIMQPPMREYYRLEEIWGEKPVRLKLAPKSGGLVKAAEPPVTRPTPSVASRGALPGKQEVKRAPAKKAPARKAAAGKTAAAKGTARRGTVAAKPAPRPTAAKKAAKQAAPRRAGRARG